MASNNNNKRRTIINFAKSVAKKHNIPVDIFLALLNQESGFNPNAKSKAGAMGVGQLMPATAKALGVKDPWDYKQNIEGAAKYFKQCLVNGRNIAKAIKGRDPIDLALASYNAGIGAVKRYQGVPPYPESQNYVKSIQAGRKKFANVAPIAKVTTIENTETPTVLEGSVSNDGVITGAAANPMDAIASGYSNEDLLKRSLDPTSLEGLVDRINRQQYTNADIYRAQVNPLLNRQVGNLTQDELLALEQSRKEGLQQGLKDMMLDRSSMYDRINNAYNQYMQNLQDDYRLRNTGYNVNPAAIENYNKQLVDASIINAFAGQGYTPVNPNVQAMNTYQAQIANQYGVPYEQYMAAMADIQAKRQAAQMRQVQDYITYAKNNGATDQEIIKALGDNEFIKQAVELSKNQGDYERQVAQEITKGIGQLQSDSMKEIARIYSSLPDNAKDAYAAQVSAQTGITGDQIRAAAQKYTADTTYAYQTRGQDVDFETAKFQQPAKNVTAAGYYIGQTSPMNTTYKPQQSQGMLFALPQQSRGIVVNPNISYQDYQQLVPINTAGGENTTNPFSLDNMLNRLRQRTNQGQPNL